jgi:hypothetical protein
MAEWSPNNRACTSTWIALRVLEQSNRVFPKSGQIRMRQLAYWNSVASDAMRHLQARTLAKQMDNIFRVVQGATLEPGAKSDIAMEFMAATLIDGDRTMADLAEINDHLYRFWGER